MKHYLRLDTKDKDFPALEQKLRALGCGCITIELDSGEGYVEVECDESVAASQLVSNAMVKRFSKETKIDKEELVDFTGEDFAELKAANLEEAEKVVIKEL